MTPSQPRHPFTVAWETWQAWSDAEAMRTARRRTTARGESLAVFDQHPEWTQGRGRWRRWRPTGRWSTTWSAGAGERCARPASRATAGPRSAPPWAWTPSRPARLYLERVQRQQRVHETHPDLRRLLGYDPRWLELAEPNDADRADQQRQASGREAER